MQPIKPEDFLEPEWVEWYSLSPSERWERTTELWQTYLYLGGSLDPEPDTQSPFFDAEEFRQSFTDGRPGLHIVRRGGV